MDTHTHYGEDMGGEFTGDYQSKSSGFLVFSSVTFPCSLHELAIVQSLVFLLLQGLADVLHKGYRLLAQEQDTQWTYA